MWKSIIGDVGLLKKIKLVSLILLCLFLYSHIAYTQEKSLDALIQETQKNSQKPDQVTLLWWIPTEFWKLSMAADATVTNEQIDEIIKLTGSYTLFIVVDARMGSFGGLTYKTEQNIRDSIAIKDMKGRIYKPLSKNSIDPDTNNFLKMIKPILEEMLGSMGQNMHFVLFPSKSDHGEPIIESKNKGKFSVLLGNEEFTWKLPLDSLISVKTCPRCSEICKGSWEYCAWCGTKLNK